jgi:hypothetical protein
MPKPYTKSKKTEYTKEERYARADAKEAKKNLVKQIKQEKRDKTVQKRQATLDKSVEQAKQKRGSPPDVSTEQPAVIQPTQVDDPNRTDSDDDVRIIAVEPIKPVESKPPAKHNPDDSDTE